MTIFIAKFQRLYQEVILLGESSVIHIPTCSGLEYKLSQMRWTLIVFKVFKFCEYSKYSGGHQHGETKIEHFQNI